MIQGHIQQPPCLLPGSRHNLIVDADDVVAVGCWLLACLIISRLARHPYPPTAQCDWPVSLITAAGQSARTRPSWLRDSMPSLMKTFFRWYWTVRALRNNRAPISGLDRPSRANRAIWDSCAVS
jgi:hypothetical protein